MGSLFGPRPERQVFDLIDRRDLAGMQKLLDRTQKPVNARHPEHGGTPLHMVAFCGWDAAARLLLEAGANPNVPDTAYGALPVHVALSKRQFTVAMMLIEAGSNRHHRHKNGYTPLMVALEQKHVDSVTALLRAGINPMEGVQGLPLMAWASIRWGAMHEERDQEACAAMTMRLMEYGCELDAVATEGWTALMFAASLGQHGVARVLLEHGVDPDRTNDQGDCARNLARRALEKANQARDVATAAVLERTLLLLAT